MLSVQTLALHRGQQHLALALLIARYPGLILLLRRAVLPPVQMAQTT
jgi:hypothetical protein